MSPWWLALIIWGVYMIYIKVNESGERLVTLNRYKDVSKLKPLIFHLVEWCLVSYRRLAFIAAN